MRSGTVDSTDDTRCGCYACADAVTIEVLRVVPGVMGRSPGTLALSPGPPVVVALTAPCWA